MVIIRRQVLFKALSGNEVIQKMSMGRLEKMSEDKAMGHVQPRAMRKNVQEH